MATGSLATMLTISVWLVAGGAEARIVMCTGAEVEPRLRKLVVTAVRA